MSLLSEARLRLIHPLERKKAIPAPKPERTSRTLTKAFENDIVTQGDVLAYKTIPDSEEKVGVYLGPVITRTDKGRLHLFTEEIPTEDGQKIITEGNIIDWRKVGHRSGHWKELLKTSLPDDLSTKP